MNYKEIEEIITRTKKIAGLELDTSFSLWLGKTERWFANKKDNKSAKPIIEAIIEEGIKRDLDMNYILKGKKQSS
jgi:hypothetical protein